MDNRTPIRIVQNYDTFRRGSRPWRANWQVEVDGLVLGKGFNKAECVDLAKRRFKGRPLEFVPIPGYLGGEHRP